MANRGIGYFDRKGQFFRSAPEATMSDLSGLLGRMGDGDSLAPGIAKILLDKRRDLEHIFREHDDMVQAGLSSAAGMEADDAHDDERSDAADGSNVTSLVHVKST